MTDIDLPSKNESIRRTYHRRNRKKNQTGSPIPVTYVPLTTSIITTNNSELINASSVPGNDFFAPIAFLTQNKYFFFVGLSLLTFLCVISIVFLIVILKCIKGNGRQSSRAEKIDIRRLQTMKDFLDGPDDKKGENEILLADTGLTNSIMNSTMNTNGVLLNDNISNTFSIDALTAQKIMSNNPSNTASISLSPAADDTSLDTLRGSLVSSPSQNMSVNQISITPTRLTAPDLAPNADDRAVEAEKDDDLHDLDLKRIIPQRYAKASNSSSNLSAHRSSIGSVAEQSIRKQDLRNEAAERKQLHGSNSNLYEKEIRKQAEQHKIGNKEYTNSQVSLVSRTSEDSCY